MTRSRIWRRELAHGMRESARVNENERRVRYNLICVNGPADMSLELAAKLWPDLSPGFVTQDYWVVDHVKLDSISTTEHVEADVTQKLVGRGNEQDPNPLRRPVSWEMETEYIEIPAEFDAEGNRLENTAFEPLTGLVDFVPILVWTGVRYLTAWPPWLEEFAEMCTNSTEVNIDGFVAPPETLKMEGLRIGRVQRTIVEQREIVFRELPIKLSYKKTGWRDRYINQGRTEYFPPSHPVFATNIYTVPARRVACTDSNGKPVEKPVPLNKDGQRFRARVKAPTTDDANATRVVVVEKIPRKDLVELEFLRLKKLDFNKLLR